MPSGARPRRRAPGRSRSRRPRGREPTLVRDAGSTGATSASARNRIDMAVLLARTARARRGSSPLDGSHDHQAVDVVEARGRRSGRPGLPACERHVWACVADVDLHQAAVAVADVEVVGARLLQHDRRARRRAPEPERHERAVPVVAHAVHLARRSRSRGDRLVGPATRSPSPGRRRWSCGVARAEAEIDARAPGRCCRRRRAGCCAGPRSRSCQCPSGLRVPPVTAARVRVGVPSGPRSSRRACAGEALVRKYTRLRRRSRRPPCRRDVAHRRRACRSGPCVAPGRPGRAAKNALLPSRCSCPPAACRCCRRSS